MKKTLLAVAVAAFAATSASAAQVYDKDGTSLAIGGEMEAMYWSTHASSMENSKDQTVSDRARLNLDGRTALTDNISAYGFYEWEFEHNGDSTEGGDINARFAYLGVDFGDFGAIQVGRYEDPFQNAGDVVDNLEETGVIGGLDERNSGHLSYLWSGYGFEAAVSYQFAEDKYNADQFGTIDVNSGFSVYAAYTTPSVGLGPISIRAAYAYLKGQQDGTSNVFDDDDKAYADGVMVNNIKSWDLGLSWGTMGEGFYVATNYNWSKGKIGATVDGLKYLLDDDSITDGGDAELTFKMWESMISYGFESGVVISAAYSYIKAETEATIAGTTGKADGDSKTAQFVVSYDVNENFRVWGEAIFDVDSDDGYSQFYTKGEEEKGANAFLVAARYTF